MSVSGMQAPSYAGRAGSGLTPQRGSHRGEVPTTADAGEARSVRRRVHPGALRVPLSGRTPRLLPRPRRLLRAQRSVGLRDASATPARWPNMRHEPGHNFDGRYQVSLLRRKDSRRSERPSRLAPRGVLLEINPARLGPALQELSLLRTCRAIGESANLDRPALTIKLDCQQPLDVTRSAAA